MKKRIRLTALLLALLLVLQCAAAAAEPTAPDITEPPADSEAADVPEVGEQPEEGDIIDPAEPVEITINTSLADGQTVNNPNQTLSVSLLYDGVSAGTDQLTVKCGGTDVNGTQGVYSLKLDRGDNTIEIAAGSATKTIRVRYEIAVPAGWAHDALQFCVDYGILNGDQNGNLLPTGYASRAQLAAMLVRLFDSQNAADISSYTDVQRSSWYYGELARAVGMGLFEGSGGKLTPLNNITREQAFTVLARAFGVAAENDSALKAFPDGNQVSSWAKSTVAGMLEAGYVHGSTNGTLNPKGYITRQELAQVLYNALDCITDDASALSGKRCLYTGSADSLSADIDGSLIVSSVSGENVVLDGAKTSGRLALHLHDAKTAELTGACGTVAVCCPVELTLDKAADKLICIRDGASIHGDADTVIVVADTVLDGTYRSVIVQSGKLTLAPGTTVRNLSVSPTASKSRITVNGKAEIVDAYARSLTINGSGHIGTINQHYADTKFDCAYEQLVNQIDAGLSGISLVSVNKPTAYYDSLNLTPSAKVTGVNTEQAFGVPDGIRTCTVTYSYNGKTLKVDNNFKLTEGAVLSCPVEAVMTWNKEETQYITATINYESETFTGYIPFISSGRWSDLQLAKSVLTVHVLAVMNYTTTLYNYSSLTSPITTLAAGTAVHFLKFSEDGGIALVETMNGTRGWCAGSAVRVSWQNYHNDDVSYTTGTKEAFVNQLHDYSSPTKYLIWCNLYTTTVNIFEGSKGNWKLIKSCECVIGAPNTPTRPGVYSIYSHAYYWSFDSGGTLDVDRAYYASLFDGGIAFHTRLYYTGTNQMVNSALSAELSHGCVRCPDDIAQFIYYNCPTGTTVVVY